MDDLGTVTLILLLGVGFALHVGSLAMGLDLGSGFTTFIEAITEYNINGLLNLIKNAIMSPVSAATLAFAIGASFISSQSVRYTFAVAVLVALSTILFMPFTILNEAVVAIPVVIRYLIQGFFALLMILAVIGFVMERRF